MVNSLPALTIARVSRLLAIGQPGRPFESANQGAHSGLDGVELTVAIKGADIAGPGR